MVQHFGVFAGSDVLASMLLDMTIIPVVRATLRPPKQREAERERAAGILDRFLLGVTNNLVGGRAPWISGGGLALLALVGNGTAFLHIDNNFKLYHKPLQLLFLDAFQCVMLLVHFHVFAFAKHTTKSLQDQAAQNGPAATALQHR